MKRTLSSDPIIRIILILAVIGVCLAAAYRYSYAVRSGVRAVLLAPSQRPASMGEGGPAANLILCDPMGLATDRAGNVFISDRGRDYHGRIVWRVSPSGSAQAVAGTGRKGSARRSSAEKVSLAMPEGIALDAEDRLYIADAGNHIILRIDADGLAERFAGTGTAGAAGDGGSAANAQLNRPSDIRFDSRGFLYVADVNNHRVRRIAPDGRIETVAGTGTAGFSGDGGPAVSAQLNTPWGITVDRADRLVIADSENHRIRRVEQNGTIETIAGSGRKGRSFGESQDPLNVSFDTPQGLWDTMRGPLYISDEHNNLVWALDDGGLIEIAVGKGEVGLAAEGTEALEAPMNDPEGILVLSDGSMLVADGDNGRVLRVSPQGTLHTFAGRGDISLCTG